MSITDSTRPDLGTTTTCPRCGCSRRSDVCVQCGDRTADTLGELEAAVLRRQPWPPAPRLSRQAFNYLARVIAELEFVADGGRRSGGTIHAYVREHFAYHLAETNPRFDRDRFVTAAGGER